MLRCKQVARHLADRDYAELPWLKRFGLKAHVLFCFFCGRYHRLVMRFQDGVRRYRKGEDSRTRPPEGDLCLGGDEREAIRRALAAESTPPDARGDSETGS